MTLLHGTLPPSALAYDCRAMMILQAGGHNLAGAGTVLVDQYDHGKIRERAFTGCLPDFQNAAVAAPSGNDRAGGNEHVANVLAAGSNPPGLSRKSRIKPCMS